MSVRATKRATHDFNALIQAVAQQHETIKAAVLTNDKLSASDATDVFHWRITVVPPSSSVYAGSTYDLLFILSPDHFPLQPPMVRVVTPIFSPLVHPADGSLCEGVIRNNFWKPTTDPISCVMHVVQALFVDYASLEVINEEAGKLLREGEQGVLRFTQETNSQYGQTSPLDAAALSARKIRMKNNGNANYYRFQQKLWPSEEAYEKDLTERTYSSVERTPLDLLPSCEKPQNVFACEGNGATALLERTALELAARSSDAAPSSSRREVAVMEELMSDTADSGTIDDKIITQSDIEGSVLASARDRARTLIGEDLTVNTLATTRAFGAAQDVGGASWQALGLDPLLSDVAARFYGATPTRLQTRLLPALLDEDHNDVIFNGVTGSGKTSALLLAILHGIRNESAGMNVLVASSTLNAMRLYDAVLALARRAGPGGKLVDRPARDTAQSWLMLGPIREEHNKYYAALRASLQSDHGPVRLFITTADTMCELLFEKKMEFADFGYLRRVYLDDVAMQLPMLPSAASVTAAKERARNPLAAELLLGTLHQLPGPHIRSILQLGLVSADVDGRLRDHLKALCVKPQAHTIVLSPVRLPTTLHCLFSLYLPLAMPPRDGLAAYRHLAQILWAAKATLVGRVVIFVQNDADMLRVRHTLRGLGIDAKLFSEVYADGTFRTQWKFVLLREAEAFGIDVPLVSHVFITFVPGSWQSYLHMCGRAGRLGNVGWVYTIADRRAAKALRRVADDLAVAFCDHVVDAELRQVDPQLIERMTREPTPYGLDPQYVVQQHYEVQAESPESAYRSREFFSKPAVRQFQMEDYTPVAQKQRRYDNASKLARDIAQNPQRALELQAKGLLDAQLRPTRQLKEQLDLKSAPTPHSR